jgi:hypothetical protein
VLDDGGLGTELGGDGGKLHRDDAGTDEGDACRELVEIEEVAAVVDVLGAGDGKLSRMLACAENDRLGRDALISCLDCVGIDERTMGMVDRHAGLLEHAFEHRVHRVHDLLLVGHELLRVYGRHRINAHAAEALEAIHIVERRIEQDLRIAAPVRAGAGNRILLDKGNALSCFPEHQRCMPCCVA